MRSLDKVLGPKVVASFLQVQSLELVFSISDGVAKSLQFVPANGSAYTSPLPENIVAVK